MPLTHDPAPSPDPDASHRAPSACSLCKGLDLSLFHRDVGRSYWRCARCKLVQVPPAAFLSPADEKACYDHHQNDPQDAGYRRFLSRLADPLIARLPPGAQGLDFGCGPGPTLSIMLEEAGFPTAIYDRFYAPDNTVWQRHYDFITASEVVEHLQHPAAELHRLWAHLKPTGHLAIMTKRVHDADAFATWHYKNDPTHVAFFSDQTFHWLAQHLNASLDIVGPDVVILRKPEMD